MTKNEKKENYRLGFPFYLFFWISDYVITYGVIIFIIILNVTTFLQKNNLTPIELI